MEGRSAAAKVDRGLAAFLCRAQAAPGCSRQQLPHIPFEHACAGFESQRGPLQARLFPVVLTPSTAVADGTAASDEETAGVKLESAFARASRTLVALKSLATFAGVFSTPFVGANMSSSSSFPAVCAAFCASLFVWLFTAASGECEGEDDAEPLLLSLEDRNDDFGNDGAVATAASSVDGRPASPVPTAGSPAEARDFFREYVCSSGMRRLNGALNGSVGIVRANKPQSRRCRTCPWRQHQQLRQRQRFVPRNGMSLTKS